jgi:hypothetical protein
MITIDMTKARNIKRDMIRAERAPMLAALDVEFTRALESGDTVKQAEIVAKKQMLRNAPQDPRIAAAQTPDELASLDVFTPAVVQEPNPVVA